MFDFIIVLCKICLMFVFDVIKWRCIGGDLYIVNFNVYVLKDGSKIMGIWICMLGKFEVNYEKWEYCYFFDGYCIIMLEGEEL